MRSWLSFVAALLGLALLLGITTFWVQREVLHVTHIEQVTESLSTSHKQSKKRQKLNETDVKYK